MYFKVFDKNGNDITNNSYVITPDGKICGLGYKELIEMDGVSATLYFNDGSSQTFQ